MIVRKQFRKLLPLQDQRRMEQTLTDQSVLLCRIQEIIAAAGNVQVVLLHKIKHFLKKCRQIFVVSIEFTKIIVIIHMKRQINIFRTAVPNAIHFVIKWNDAAIRFRIRLDDPTGGAAVSRAIVTQIVDIVRMRLMKDAVHSTLQCFRSIISVRSYIYLPHSHSLHCCLYPLNYDNCSAGAK